jgi:hypothetical protein
LEGKSGFITIEKLAPSASASDRSGIVQNPLSMTSNISHNRWHYLLALANIPLLKGAAKWKQILIAPADSPKTVLKE